MPFCHRPQDESQWTPILLVKRRVLLPQPRSSLWKESLLMNKCLPQGRL